MPLVTQSFSKKDSIKFAATTVEEKYFVYIILKDISKINEFYEQIY
jgi:hypothetical protein